VDRDRETASGGIKGSQFGRQRPSQWRRDHGQNTRMRPRTE